MTKTRAALIPGAAKELREDVQALINSKRKSAYAYALAICITVLYGAGIAGLCLLNDFDKLLAVVPLLVAQLWAWYLGHDCAHLSALRTRRANYMLGQYLSHFCGVGYFVFRDYARDHLRHHSQAIDIVGVDLVNFAFRFPRITRWIFLPLERAYIPLVHLYIKGVSIASIFREADPYTKLRATAGIAMVVAQGILFFLYGGAIALAAMLVAAALRIHLVRFVDAFQHSYEQWPQGTIPSTHRSRGYEQQNTFSLPFGPSHRILNYMTLNFSYHNAHHAFPACPWYLLPEVDTLLSCKTETQSTVAQVPPLLRHVAWAYHRKRTSRIFSGDEGHGYDRSGNFSLREFHGAFTDNLLG